jgi:protein gp37
VSENSKIEWTHHTYNSWWGCIEDGPECDHCYARAFSKRTGHDVWGLGGRRFFGANHWKEPVRWNADAEAAGERRRVFCGSMMDIGERRNDEVGQQMDEARSRLWLLVKATPWLDWLLLTKRPQNLHTVLPEPWVTDRMPQNVWLGTTAGNPDGWEKRVKYLRKLNPVVRFVSVEPQLASLGGVDLTGIHWLIQGGESGGNPRPFDIAWARSLRDDCAKAGVAYFFKQAGARVVDSDRQQGQFAEHDKRSIAAAAALGCSDNPPNLIVLRSRKGNDLSELRGDFPRQFPTVSA